METRTRRRVLSSQWSRPMTGIAIEPVTNWQPPAVEPPRLSPRVKLEVDILSSDQVTPVPVLTRRDVRLRRTVLLVSRQAEVRRHLRACLQAQSTLRLVEVNSVSAAVSLTSEVAVHLIIADPGTVGVMSALPQTRTILVADEMSGVSDFIAGPGRHVMQRPFSAETLAATVMLLLAESGAG